MIDIGKGVICGLIASALLAGAIYLGSISGVVQPIDPLRATSGIMLSPAGLSWVIYVAMGALFWGTLFALLHPILPGPLWFRGIVFGSGAWLLTIVVIWVAEPTAGLQVGYGPLVLHLAFGSVLGFTYGVLLDRPKGRISGTR